ncbi:hypothetical protein [Mycobacterium pinniadriaticum]|uniref:hypothetical protein n=1 Tax=Mycobacterium pinniadriaticum TaxID=2994102 RepID=UPI002B058BD4|nr:hypothetical protein [Mycobacterium pinniadriaticum]
MTDVSPVFITNHCIGSYVFGRELAAADGADYESIALHTSLGLVHRFGPVQAVSHFGIALDINGFDKHRLSTGFAERVHAAWPRHDLGYAIAEAIAGDARVNPTKAPPFSFPAHLDHLINGARRPRCRFSASAVGVGV